MGVPIMRRSGERWMGAWRLMLSTRRARRSGDAGAALRPAAGLPVVLHARRERSAWHSDPAYPPAGRGGG